MGGGGKVEVGVRLGGFQRVSGKDRITEPPMQTVLAKRDLHLVVAAVGADCKGNTLCVQPVQQFGDARDHIHARAQRGVGLGIDFVYPIYR